MVDYYNNAISELFDDWWQMPRPDEFDAIKGSARQAAHLLAYQAQTNAGPGCAEFGANGELSNITTMQQYLSNFNGAAIRTFMANYANRLPSGDRQPGRRRLHGLDGRGRRAADLGPDPRERRRHRRDRPRGDEGRRRRWRVGGSRRC